MRNHLRLISVLTLACAMVMLLAVPSSAQQPFLKRVRKIYGLTEKVKCTLCHTYDKSKDETPGRKNLNVYGKQIQAVPEMKPLLDKDDDYKFSAAELEILEKAVKSLEDKDADGDGATNKEETLLGTNPGDPKSTPTKEELEAFRKNPPKN